MLAVLLMVIPPVNAVVLEPVMVAFPDPEKVIMLVLAVNVPLLVRLPLMVIAAPSESVPAVMVTLLVVNALV